MIRVPFYWLDVFTNQQFKGNPAAVCFMRTDYPDNVYQSIASELKLSETAFAEKIKKTSTSSGGSHLRWRHHYVDTQPWQQHILCLLTTAWKAQFYFIQ